MVVKEKKLREKLVNSLKLQQQQAMFHQQKKVEKVVRGKVSTFIFYFLKDVGMGDLVR